MSDTAENFNPEYNPNGAEGSLDTNKLPWIPLDNVKGLSIKPVIDCIVNILEKKPLFLIS